MDMTITDSEIIGGYLETAVSVNAYGSGVESSILTSGYATFTPPYTATQATTSAQNQNALTFLKSSKEYYRVSVYYRQKSGAPIIDEGYYFDLITGNFNVYSDRTYNNTLGTTKSISDYWDASKINLIQAILWDGVPSSTSQFKVVDCTDGLIIDGTNFGVKIKDCEAPFDVQYVEIDFYLLPDALSWDTSSLAMFKSWYGANVKFNYSESTFSLEEKDQSTGLLKGVIEWLQSIRDGIVNVKNSIVELPNKIWAVMENGIKGLIVPSEEDISNMHNQWDELMRDRFGAIYESGDIVHQFAQTMETSSVMVADNGGVITMPSATINVAGTAFTFGGYEVDLVPNGFQWLVDTIKMVVNIVCTNHWKPFGTKSTS